MQGQTFGKVQTVLETQTQELVPKKQVGILGGNFNPVHYAHLVMGEQVGQALGLDKVYFMPEYLPPHVDEKRRSQLSTAWRCWSWRSPIICDLL